MVVRKPDLCRWILEIVLDEAAAVAAERCRLFDQQALYDRARPRLTFSRLLEMLSGFTQEEGCRAALDTEAARLCVDVGAQVFSDKDLESLGAVRLSVDLYAPPLSDTELEALGPPRIVVSLGKIAVEHKLTWIAERVFAQPVPLSEGRDRVTNEYRAWVGDLFTPVVDTALRALFSRGDDNRRRDERRLFLQNKLYQATAEIGAGSAFKSYPQFVARLVAHKGKAPKGGRAMERTSPIHADQALQTVSAAQRGYRMSGGERHPLTGPDGGEQVAAQHPEQRLLAPKRPERPEIADFETLSDEAFQALRDALITAEAAVWGLVVSLSGSLPPVYDAADFSFLRLRAWLIRCGVANLDVKLHHLRGLWGDPDYRVPREHERRLERWSCRLQELVPDPELRRKVQGFFIRLLSTYGSKGGAAERPARRKELDLCREILGKLRKALDGFGEILPEPRGDGGLRGAWSEARRYLALEVATSLVLPGEPGRAMQRRVEQALAAAADGEGGAQSPPKEDRDE